MRTPRSASPVARLLASLAFALGGRALGAPLTVPGTDGRLEASGYIDGLAVVDTGGGRRQRPQGLGELRLDTAVTRALRGHLALRGWVGGPIEGGHAGIYDLVHTFQNHSVLDRARADGKKSSRW